jgi:hypothetical protein
MRLIAGLAAPFVVPPLRLWRLLAGFRHRSALWGALAESLPVVLLTYCVCAIGESIGYLFGGGDANERLLYYELNCPRV